MGILAYKRVLTFLALFAAFASAQTPAPISSWDAAAKAESELNTDPDNLAIRGQLIQFYYSQSLRAQFQDRAKPLRRKHVVWMIEHHPESRMVSGRTGAIEPSGSGLADPEGYAQCGVAWQKVLSAPKPLFDAFANAIAFYRNTDLRRAREIAEAGLKLCPGNANISRQKGMLLAYSIEGGRSSDFGRSTGLDETRAASDEAKQDRAALLASNDINLLSAAASGLAYASTRLRPRNPALAQEIQDFAVEVFRHWAQIDPNSPTPQSALVNAYQEFSALAAPEEKVALLEKALALADSPGMRLNVLPSLANAYMDAENPARAVEAANELLKLAQSRNSTDFDGAAFTANTVLGRAALMRGDVKEAATRLLAAGAAPASGGAQRLAATGPTDWRLAQDLLSAGYRDSVLAYIAEVRGWWKNGATRLNAFESSIQNGLMPDFKSRTGYSTAQLVGRPAPDLRLPDLNGREIVLSDFKGKIVLVDFWATWCGPCREEMPELERIQKHAGGQDPVILTVDADETRDTVAAYMEKNKFTFPALLAKGTDAIARWGVSGYPTTIAIDRNGLIADIAIGFMPGRDTLSAVIEKARAGAPPSAGVKLPPAIASGVTTPPPPALAPRPAGTTPAPAPTAPSTPAVTAEDFYRDARRQRNAREHEAGIRSATRALELRPDWALALTERASIEVDAKRYDDAIADFSRAIELDPGHAFAYNSLGIAYSRSGRYAQAILIYTRAIELDPQDSAAYNNRGWAHLQAGALDEALADLNKAVKLFPAFTLALSNRALLFEKRGEYGKAIADHDAILRLDPRNASAARQKSVDAALVGAGSREPPAPGAPRLLSPADGAVFDVYPRATTVTWSAVPGAAAYVVEWDYLDGSGWASERSSSFGSMRATQTTATFGFVGAQPGRWRVYAVDEAGAAGPKSEWRLFRYTR